MTPPVPLARWWREPWWARLTLLGIVAGSASLMSWNLARGGDFSFYEAAARSMSESWHALVFGAFDPTATVTLDKLAGFAVPQALGIRLFGMLTSSIALPQVVEGIVTILACAVVGLRWGGRGMGLVAAAAAASTPIFVSMFGHPMEDGLLTMALAVALVWWQRAILSGRWWPLLVAGLFIGVGFQAKMMSAWFVLPGLVVATFLAVAGARRRWGRVAALTGSAVLASLSWMIVLAWIPASARPFIDGSTDNDVFAMVFGYNGLDRLVPNAVPGAIGSRASLGGLTSVLNAFAHIGQAGSATGSGTGNASLTKLVESPLVTQIGWLYPAAGAAVVLGVLRWWPRRSTGGRLRPTAVRTDRALFAAVVLWAATTAAFLTAARVPHTAYVAGLGVPLALLTAFAWSEAIRLQASTRWRARLVAPILLAAQSGWWTFLSVQARMPIVLVTLAIAAWSVGAFATIVTLWTRARQGGARRRAFVATALAVAMLAGPIAFSTQVIDANRDGTGADAYVGIPAKASNPHEAFAPSSPAPWGGTPPLSPALTQLIADARKDGGGTNGQPLFVSDSWAISAAAIVATGADVLTDGGYSGAAPVFSEKALKALVAHGRAHLFVVASNARTGDPVKALVKDEHCGEQNTWHLAAAHEGGDINGVSGATLYVCT